MLCYSLDVSCQDASNEYLQRIFSWRNEKNIYLIPHSYLDLYQIPFLLTLSFLELECSFYYLLTLVLLNPDMPCLYKECRSRSVGFCRSPGSALFVIEYVTWLFVNNWIKPTDWLTIRSGHGILIY